MLNEERRKSLFDAATKFESGTGWPSFWQPLDGAVGEHEDRSFFMVRTEVHCANCGGHLGHGRRQAAGPVGLDPLRPARGFVLQAGPPARQISCTRGSGPPLG